MCFDRCATAYIDKLLVVALVHKNAPVTLVNNHFLFASLLTSDYHTSLPLNTHSYNHPQP